MNAVAARLIAGFALCLGSPAWAAAPDGLVARGAEIYLHGRLGDGSMLEGRRDAGHPPARGAEAACVNCHRHSGLGATEGRIHIPPVTGRFLMPPHYPGTDRPMLPYVENMHGGRKDYTEASLALAIRDGVDADGMTMSTLMPRFALGGDDMAALIAYLKSMDRAVQPGVTDTVLHFATVLAPDADAVEREATLAVLDQFIKDQNEKAFLVGPAPTVRASGRSSVVRMLALSPRRWDLHVWELSGPPESWRAQLEAAFARQPVLAVLSGVGGRDWSPVHRFCESAAVPCIFPNVDLPVDRPDDFYSMYLSGGLELEASLIAARITEPAGRNVSSAGHPVVRQVYRAGGVGEGAAGLLATELAAHGVEVRNVSVPADAAAAGIDAALHEAADADDLVLWLKPADVAALAAVPPQAKRIFLSGRMGGLEDAPLPEAWRTRSIMAFPVDLPEKRDARLVYVREWLRNRKVPITDLPVQADTWLACSVLNETLHHINDAFIPEYVVERVYEDLEHRFITGYYPRLSLAEHQRFASKGGYIVRFADAAGHRVVPVGDWFVP